MEQNGLAKKMGDKIETFGNKIERVGDTVEHLGETQNGSAKLGDTQAGRKLQQVTDKVADKASQATNQASDWISDATAKVRSFQSDTVDYIKARPLAFIAGAIALGFVANRLLSSGKSEK